MTFVPLTYATELEKKPGIDGCIQIQSRFGGFHTLWLQIDPDHNPSSAPNKIFCTPPLLALLAP